MAELTREDVLKLARLARLHLTDDEVEQFRGEISAILDYVAQLQSADLNGLEPTYQVTGLKNVTRLDEILEYGASSEELLKNAPAKENGHFNVKRVVQ